MRILTDILDKMDGTLEEVSYYIDEAFVLKAEHKALADTYVKISEMHLDIYKMLHDRVISIIEEQKKIAPAPESMKSVWEYEHSRLVKEFNSLKFQIEEYKKSY